MKICRETIFCFVAVATIALLLQTGCRPRSAAEVPVAAVSAPVKVSFNERIQPILSENCYQCHGPDRIAQKGELRLDRPEDSFAPRKNGRAIVKGDPEHSLVIRRLLSKDPEEVMPPPETHKRLKPEEIALLRRWISEGAVYEKHWAFIAPSRPALPATARNDWARNPIDRFILARLETEKLSPSPEADRASLIRRVAYDLTGLPPAPEEVAAFLADPAPDAYERVVDRFLASPRYGEHRARYWLDYARYGDTHGLHLDNSRHIWPYRDYVIRAFNANMPFDRFTREQIAGDLLPPRNLDQQLASAFLRAGISTGEGGTILQELRANLQQERVEAYGSVYLGLTVSCATCHDHKFDPISQKDHYQLAAFFNNLDENPNNEDHPDWPPSIRLPKPEDLARYNDLLSQRAGLQATLANRRDRARELIARWLAGGPPARAISAAGLQVRLRFDEQQGATFVNSAPTPLFARATATGGTPIWGEDTWFWPSFRMETSTRIELPGTGDIERTDAFSAGTWLMPSWETTSSTSPKSGTILGRMDATAGMRGWDLVFDEGKLGFRLVHQEKINAIEVKTSENTCLKRGRWNHVLVVYDGSGKAAGVRLYIDGKLQKVDVLLDSLTESVRTTAPFLLGCIHPDASPLRQSRYQDLRFYARALDTDEAPRLAREDYAAALAARPPATWNEDETQAATDFYFQERDPESAALQARLTPLQNELDALTKDGPVALVSAEAPRLAYADVLKRGVYTDRIERVRPAAPHFLPPLPADAPRDRRGLAEWTVRPDNPLTARVTVNRMWAELFGVGIVETTEDFGVVGARPSHPQLLDWLAVEFRESGWDVKHMYRLLVTSAAYRQSARITPELLEKDPKNRLVARGPRFRMDAEMIRDTALAASGLLVDKIGGPSVRPYQPPGVWETNGFPDSDTLKYVQDTGASLYRRSIYTFWKRLATMPNMDAFDAPTREASCTRRQRTNTPLQALVTMNDVQWLEAARRIAENLLHETGTDDDSRLNRLAQLLLARAWAPAEKTVLLGKLAEFRATYTADPASAAALVAVGDSKPGPALAPPDLAAWMLVASIALNLDATINK